MKKCKKIFILEIIIMILMTINVYANTTGGITIKSTETFVAVGDKIEVIVSAECANGIEGVDGILKYDNTKLKLINENELAISDFDSVSGMDEKTGEFRLSILYSGTQKAPNSADVAKLNFEVLDDAIKSETVDVQLIDAQIGDSNDEWIEPEDATITLTVENANPPKEGLGLIHYAIIIIVVIILIAIVSRSKRKR